MSRRQTAYVGALCAMAAISAFGCGGYSSPMAPSPGGGSTAPAADVVITILGVEGGMSFAPATATIKVGQTVAWRNADSITHDVEQDAAGGFDTDSLAGGATSKPITITQAGTIPYHCTIHPSMVGTLTATK